MLTFFDRDGSGSRRDFLRVGGSVALGAAGLTMAHLAALRARAEGRAAPALLTGKSVIFLFLHGGPSQFETFDPKMDRPEGIRSATGEIATALPGVTFGGSFPRLAALADRLTIVRSFVPGDANHDIKPLVGRDTFGANLGSRLRPRRRRRTTRRPACPTNVVLFPRAVDADDAAGHDRASAGSSATGPARPRPTPLSTRAGGGAGADDLKLAIPRDRLDDRRRLLARLDGLARRLDGARAVDGVDRLRDQAYRLLDGGLADAFDLAREDPRTRRPLRHRAAGPARGHQQEVEQPQELRRQRQVAGQAAAAGPPALRARGAGSSR